MAHADGNPTWVDGVAGGTPVDAVALENIEGEIDTLASGGGSVGWWTGWPCPPVGFDQWQTGPFLIHNGTQTQTFTHITGPMWLPGPQTLSDIQTRTSIAGAAGSVGTVYYQANVAGTLPNRATATAIPDTLALDGAIGAVSKTLTTALVVPSTGMWFWFESTDTTASVRVAVPVGPNSNWSGAGSLNAAGLPVAGSNTTNSDLSEQFAPALFFRRSA